MSHVWGRGALEGVARNGAILFLGAGLTMVDALLALSERGCGGPYHVLSRRGRLPVAHPETPCQPNPAGGIDGSSLVEVLHSFRRELRAAGAAGCDWRALVDGLRPETATLWRQWSRADRRRFLRHLRPLWDAVRHRMAPSVATKVHELLRNERLRVHAATLVGVSASAQGLVARVRPRGSGRLHSLSVATIVNCTGPNSDLRKLKDPLVTNLLHRGFIAADSLGLGIETHPDGRVIARNGSPVEWLHTLGPPCKATLWETTAVAEIRDQAVALAALLGAPRLGANRLTSTKSFDSE